MALVLIPCIAFGISDPEKNGTFFARVSRINEKADLVRAKSDFPNVKYLNKKDIVEMYGESAENVRCRGFVVGKSNDYVLMKFPGLDKCSQKVNLTVGSLMKFFSRDLENNLRVGREVVELLLKKRQALQAMVDREKIDLEKFIERVEATNKRFEALRAKLEEQWQGEVTAIEHDKVGSLKIYQDVRIRLAEIDKKLEQYRVEDPRLLDDRWALDETLYSKK
jgi:hypothetical protein